MRGYYKEAQDGDGKVDIKASEIVKGIRSDYEDYKRKEANKELIRNPQM